MEDKITINFGNIVEEMKNRQLKLCLLNNNRSWCVMDNNNCLYHIEQYYYGSYLDNLINKNITVEFNLTDANIEEWEMEVWDVEKVEDFIERHTKYWQ